MDLNQFSTVDIVLDKANDNFIQKQTISAGDRDGRSLTLQVTDAGSIGEVPGLTVNLLWTNHSSGVSDLSAFSVVDRATSVFKINYPQNMLTAGKVTAQIQLLHNGKVTHSKKFEIIVLDIAGKLKGVLQTAEYTALVEALAKANEFETEIAEVNAQLAQTAKLTEVRKNTDLQPINVREMDTETKALFTGGAVAVVGVDAVGSENIKAKAITGEKVDFLSQNKNLLNRNTITPDTLLSNTGVLTSNTAYSTTDFISVKGGTTYTINKGVRYVCFYNPSKAWVSNIHTTANYSVPTTITPQSDGYIRISLYKDTALFESMAEGLVATTEKYGFTLNEQLLSLENRVKTTDIQEGAVTPKETNFVEYTKNLFNKAEAITGYYVDRTTGNPVAYAGYSLSEFIEVNPNTQYARNYSHFGAFYNENKVFISGIDRLPAQTDASTFTTPNQAKFMRMSVINDFLDSFQIEEGSPTSFVDYGLQYKVPLITEKSQKEPVWRLVVTKTGNAVSVRSNLDDLKDIIIRTSENGSNNGSFNFVNTSLIDKGLNSNSEVIHSNSDDITPIRTSMGTVGANHGYMSIIKVTMAGHNKVTADLGSQWTDGVTVYTLLDISGNDLTFGCPYTVTNGIVSSVAVTPVANLTHVSGATNTTAVSITTLVANPQLFPSTNNKSVKYLLDGVEISNDGIYYGNELQVSESYNIMDYQAIVDYAQANIGKSYKNDSVAGAVRLSINYTFGDKGSCTIHHSIRAIKKITLGDCGFIQTLPIARSGQKLSRYLPNVLSKGGVDFNLPVDMTTYNQSLVFGKADYVNPDTPPSRHIDWLSDSLTGVKKVGFSMGYFVDKSNAKNSDRLANTTNGWDMRSTKKSYPIAISGVTLNAGDYKNFICYRNYLSPNWKSNATSFYITKDKKDTYIYIDYHTSVSFESIKLNDYLGKNITEVDKSADFTLHNDIVDADGVIFSVANNYGYAILKIS